MNTSAIPARKKSPLTILILTAFSFFVFLLPIKFGLPAGLPETAISPANTAEWLYFSWPPVLFSVAAFAFCILVQLAVHRIYSTSFCRKSLIVILLWIAILPASLPGMIKASCWDFPVLNVLFAAGIAAIAISALLVMQYDSDIYIDYVICPIVYGTLFVALYGLYQYFYGFDETRSIIAGLVKKSNVVLPVELKGKLDQNMIFSTFSISNNLAAHLILTIPLCLWFVWIRVKNIYLRYLFFYIVGLLLVAALLLTGSRAAVVSMAAALIIYVFIFYKSKMYVLFTSAACLAATAFYFFIYSIKPAESLLIRLDYYRSAIALFYKHLFTGAGWGEYFFQYSFMKTFVSPEASHSPHCFLLSFASQSGIAGFAVVAMILVIPSWFCIKALKKLPTPGLVFDFKSAALTGWLAWSIHSLMDINAEIPATMAVAVFITSYMVFDKEDNQNAGSPKLNRTFNIAVAAFSLILCGFGVWLGLGRYKGEILIREICNICSPVERMLQDKNDDINKTMTELFSLTEDADKTLSYSPVPYAFVGAYAMNNRRWLMAENCYAEAINRSPENSFYYYSIAYAQIYSGNTSSGIQNLKKAALLFPFKYKRDYEEQLKAMNK